MKRFSLAVLLTLTTSPVWCQSKVLDSLERIVALHPTDTLGARALGLLGEQYSRNDIPKAKAYLHRQLQASTKLRFITGISSAYSLLVPLHQNTGQLDSATYYLHKHEELLNQHPNHWAVRLNYPSSAGLFYKNQGMAKEALPYMLKGIENGKGRISNTNLAGQMLNVGNAYNNLGDLKTAIRYHLDALKLFESEKNLRGQGMTLQSVGTDYLKLKQFPHAKKYLEQSLTLKKQLNDQRGIVTCLIGLGEVSTALNRFKEGEDYLFEAKKLSNEMKLTLQERNIEYELGLLYAKWKKLPQAKASFEKSLALSKQLGDSTLTSEIRGALSNVTATSKPAEHEAILLETLRTTEDSGKKLSIAASYENLTNHYVEQKQFEKAFYAYKKYDEILDSTKGSAVLLQINELEKKYETEKQRDQIALLKKQQELDHAELKIQKDRQFLIAIGFIALAVIAFILINRYRVIQTTRRQLEMEKMRSTIARDLHDDIGSTLSSINIISTLALTQHNGETTKQFARISEHSSRMMESMSDIVWSINPGHDSLDDVVAKMREFALEILEPKQISLSFKGHESIHGVTLDLSKRKNIFLIFKEVLNNAAKYSQGSEVHVTFERIGHQLRLTITDNGIGFDSASVKLGNGHRTLQERAKVLNGTLSFESSPGKGTAVTVTIPLA